METCKCLGDSTFVLLLELIIHKVIQIWLNLFLNSLIPPSFSQSPAMLEIPPISLQNPLQVINRGERSHESGLFQTFTSYLATYTADDPPEPSDEELNDTLCTVDCLKACPLEDVFKNLLYVF